MDWEEFLEVFIDSLEIEDMEIEKSTNLEEIEEWDSVGLISLIAGVEDEFDTVLNPDSLGECQSVEDVFNLLKA